jgi:hypothetical protein
MSFVVIALIISALVLRKSSTIKHG